MSFRTIRLCCAAAALAFTPVMALSAQAKRATKPAASAAPSLVGQWSGTASVPLPDSTIVVPVFYTFTQSGSAIGGTALVPGQGSGVISNVVTQGTRVTFRVTAAEGRMLEHDGKFAANGGIEGVVNMDNAPIATFKITPKPPAKPAAKPLKP